VLPRAAFLLTKERGNMARQVADAVVVACTDFRFQEFLKRWLDEKYEGKKYDYIGFAGATKELRTVLNQIDISYRLHHIHEVALIHHEECGAYGKESSLRRHTEDLRKAYGVVKTLYPEMEIKLFYLTLEGKFEKIAAKEGKAKRGRPRKRG